MNILRVMLADAKTQQVKRQIHNNYWLGIDAIPGNDCW